MDLAFRPIEQEDLPQLRDWRNKEPLRRRMREWRLLNMVNQREWFQKVSSSTTDRMFGITVLIAGERLLIGACGLCHINWKDRNAEISLYIGDPAYRTPEVWGRVLVKLADIGFGEYGLHRLWAEVYSFFLFGQNCLERGGYKQEGQLRDVAWYAGAWWPSIIYGLLETEWSTP